MNHIEYWEPIHKEYKAVSIEIPNNDKTYLRLRRKLEKEGYFDKTCKVVRIDGKDLIKGIFVKEYKLAQEQKEEGKQE